MSNWDPYKTPSAKSSSSGRPSSDVFTKLAAAAAVGVFVVALVCLAVLVLLYADVGKLMTTTAAPPTTTTTAPPTTTTTAPPTTTTTTAGRCPCDWSRSKTLFFPYGAENGDFALSSISVAVTYFIDSAIGYTLFGRSGELKPIGIKLLADRGLVNVGPLENGKVSSTNFGKVSGTISSGYDDTLKDNEGEDVFHRKLNLTDVAKLQCLLPDKQIKQAYLFTWTNIRLSTEVVGSFQIAVIFMADSSTYVIRNYDDNMKDIIGQTEMYKIVDVEAGRKYYASLTAADVRGKRQSFVISEPAFGDTLISFTENEYTVCSS